MRGADRGRGGANTAQVTAVQSVAVIGLGVIAARTAQAFAVDLDEAKLPVAESRDPMVKARADAAAQVREMTGGGCDVVIEKGRIDPR